MADELSESARVLVVDDHREMIELLADRLAEHGWEASVATGGAEAIARLDESPPDVVVTDLRMEEVDGFDLLEAAHERDPNLPVVIMTAFGEIDSAVEAIKRGAFHYMTKPFEFDELEVFLERALENRRLQRENQAYRRSMAERAPLEKLVGTSEPVVALRETIERVARTDAPVTIRGESGSGKELVARAVHGCSARHAEPFVPVNCAVLPEHLLESELFGHAEGAFTGAEAARAGLFVEADGGSLFLDEIGDMPPSLQAKLLRALEEESVRPVGADRPRSVDVRVLAATHRDLETRIETGEFREDLFYRLNVIPVRVPALRERRGDIPLLVEHFLAEAASSHPESDVEAVDEALVAELQAREWPGNVRQLKNVVERLVVLGDGPRVDLEALRDLGAEPASAARYPIDPDELRPLEEMTNEYIRWVVDRCDGNKTRAAEILEIDVSTIYRRFDSD